MRYQGSGLDGFSLLIDAGDGRCRRVIWVWWLDAASATSKASPFVAVSEWGIGIGGAVIGSGITDHGPGIRGKERIGRKRG